MGRNRNFKRKKGTKEKREINLTEAYCYANEHC